MTEHGGFTMGSPLGITTAANPDVALKCAGFEAPCSGSDPDFSRIPGDWAAGGFPGGERPILAMSLGIDIINVVLENAHVEGFGVEDVATLFVPQGGWLALNFAVDVDGFVGGDPVTATAIIESGAQAKSSVFNFLLPESAVDSTPEDYETALALGPDDLEIEATDDIEALNMHMALYDSELIGSGSPFFTGLLPIPPDEEVFVYFTLRPEFVQAAGNWNGWNTPIKDGAVYRSRWNHGEGIWDLPELYRDDFAQNEVITGLAMNVSADREEILFSTRDATSDMQFEYAAYAGGGGALDTPRRRVVVREGGKRKSLGRRVGAGRGVGDFCTQDPWNGMLTPAGTPVPGGPPVLDDFVVARRLFSPVAGMGGFHSRLSVSGFRHAREGKPCFRSCMNFRGWPKGSGHAFVAWFVIPHYGIAESGVMPMPPYAPPLSAWVLIRVDSFAYRGGPVHRDVEFPSLFGGDTWRPALAAQWVVVRDGHLFIGPVSVLRMG